ncbi:response regulator [Tateyamaria sp. SN3-11]|uniref:response regulator n=1 Tax=Tateyamaria sp. SN3-11 TaxID=3092147 RepID=UPI0039EA92F9
MPAQTILVVDDDPRVRNLLRNVLEDEGFAVVEEESAIGVMRALKRGQVDLVTLDIHLGADNGIELARDIRRTSRLPIIMVTGKDDVIDRVVGLEVGADDYITKPFHVREVTARVKSVLRRTLDVQTPYGVGVGDQPPVSQLSFDGMIATPDRLELLDRAGQDCGLTSGDFKLLNVFLDRPKRVLSRDQLMDLTGGIEWTPLDRTIDNQVARLRKKIERDPSKPQLIKTVRGIGYVLVCDVRQVHLSPSPAKSA